MKYSLIVECPNGTDIDALADSVNPAEQEIYQIIRVQLNAIWPSNPMPGSSVVDGRVLIHAVIESNSADPLSDLQALIVGYALDWQILAMQTFKATESYISGQDSEGSNLFDLRADKIFAPDITKISSFVPGSTPFSSLYAGQALWET